MRGQDAQVIYISRPTTAHTYKASDKYHSDTTRKMEKYDLFFIFYGLS